MALLWIPILSLLASVIASVTGNLNRTTSAWLTATMPAIALGIAIYYTPVVFAGKTLLYSLQWIPAMGINLSFRLDGLALLFVFII